jgi:hypothetical protein
MSLLAELFFWGLGSAQNMQTDAHRAKMMKNKPETLKKQKRTGVQAVPYSHAFRKLFK